MNKTTRFKKVAIANRGEAAVRFLHGARAWAAQSGLELRVLSLYTSADNNAHFVRSADEAHCIGPALVTTPSGETKSAYVDVERVLDALAQNNVEAVWPGWGFLAENADFSRACRERGIVFMGPPPEAIEALGDKVDAKRLAHELDIPTIPWSGEPIPDLETLKTHATRIGYPLTLKAAQGGGGRGIRHLDNWESLETAFESVRAEAQSSFGDATIFLEKRVDRALFRGV